MRRRVISLVAGLLVGTSCAAGTYDEDHYNRLWCDQHGGQAEVSMPSGARADCVTADYAVEADWSDKWAEAIGQSLHYAGQTGKKPAILFLLHEDSKPAHLYRLEQTIQDAGLDIVVFVLDAPKN